MSKARITAAIFRVGQGVVLQEIDNDLHVMQEIVGGYIEPVRLWETDLIVICNEEGLLKGLPFNHAVLAQGQRLVPIVGDFLVLRDIGRSDWVGIREELDGPRIAKCIVR